MKKRTKSLLIGLALLAVMAGVALAAGSQGSQENPLITLSYLNEVVIPDLLKKADEKIAAHEEETIPGSQASFQAVELKAGGKLVLSAGAQVLLRDGKAVCKELLTDLTDGETLVGTGELKANHLYMASGDGQTVTSADGATLMVLGQWAIEK